MDLYRSDEWALATFRAEPRSLAHGSMAGSI